jgi:CRISPR-associated protein Cas5d
MSGWCEAMSDRRAEPTRSSSPRTFGVQMLVEGDRACFTRPELKVERVSYEVITPSAARGMLEAVYWKPAMRWVVDRLRVLRPIRLTQLRRNELGHKIQLGSVLAAAGRGRVHHHIIERDRQQRTATMLRDVAYVIEAHVELAPGVPDHPARHLDGFRRRLRKGRCFHQPALGCRELPARFGPVGDPPPTPHPALAGLRDLGWMLHDIDFANGMRPCFFRAWMRDGVIEVPAPGDPRIRA